MAVETVNFRKKYLLSFYSRDFQFPSELDENDPGFPAPKTCYILGSKEDQDLIDLVDFLVNKTLCQEGDYVEIWREDYQCDIFYFYEGKICWLGTTEKDGKIISRTDFSILYFNSWEDFKWKTRNRLVRKIASCKKSKIG